MPAIRKIIDIVPLLKQRRLAEPNECVHMDCSNYKRRGKTRAQVVVDIDASGSPRYGISADNQADAIALLAAMQVASLALLDVAKASKLP